MLKAVTPAARLYLEELQQLERVYASNGRYEAAIATRDERLSVTAFLSQQTNGEPATTEQASTDGKTEPTPSNTSGTLFEDSDADVSDGAEFSNSKLVLPEDGATASWELGATEPGGYEVVIGYTSEEEADIQVKESFFRLSATLPDTEGKTTTRSLGTLKITSRSNTVSVLRSGAGELPDGLVIHFIRLLSAKD